MHNFSFFVFRFVVFSVFYYLCYNPCIFRSHPSSLRKNNKILAFLGARNAPSVQDFPRHRKCLGNLCRLCLRGFYQFLLGNVSGLKMWGPFFLNIVTFKQNHKDGFPDCLNSHTIYCSLLSVYPDIYVGQFYWAWITLHHHKYMLLLTALNIIGWWYQESSRVVQLEEIYVVFLFLFIFIR